MRDAQRKIEQRALADQPYQGGIALTHEVVICEQLIQLLESKLIEEIRRLVRQYPKELARYGLLDDLRSLPISESWTALEKIFGPEVERKWLPGGSGYQRELNKRIEQCRQIRPRLIEKLKSRLKRAQAKNEDEKADWRKRVKKSVHDDLLACWSDFDIEAKRIADLFDQTIEIIDKEKRASLLIEGFQQPPQDEVKYVLRKPVQLSEMDRQLAATWIGAEHTSNLQYAEQMMVSARKAELTAIALYRELYGEAEDLAILQIVSPHDYRWHDADILSGGRFIDVKNARSDIHSDNKRHRYSRHCVPRFKQERRSGRPVSMSAFVSPYHDLGEPRVWLGEVTESVVSRLSRVFNSGYLQVEVGDPTGLRRLPPWLFDYPEPLYRDRNNHLARFRSELMNWPVKEIPAWAGALGFLLKPNDVLNDPVGMEACLLQERVRRTGLTRPVLFLHVLDRFASSLTCGKRFNHQTMREAMGIDNGYEYWVMGVWDPAEMISDLIEMLGKVDRHCYEQAMRFDSFRLSGPSILQGSVGHGDWQTVYAYCGGWTIHADGSQGPPCGRDPLHLGVNIPCNSCGKLICDKCGYCSNMCSECHPRQRDPDYWLKQKPRYDPY